MKSAIGIKPNKGGRRPKNPWYPFWGERRDEHIDRICAAYERHIYSNEYIPNSTEEERR